MIDNNQPTFPEKVKPINPQQTEEKKETAFQKKIKKARESQSLLKQIDRLEKEIASDERKLQHKKEKLALLVDKL